MFIKKNIICKVENGQVSLLSDVHSENGFGFEFYLRDSHLDCCIQSSVRLSTETLKTQAEQIINLYKLHSDRFIDFFEFDLICFFHDNKLNKLWILRDFSGSQSLYYSVVNGVLLFSLDIASLICKQINPKFSNYGLLTYLNGRAIGGKQTLFNNILSIPIAEYLMLDLSREINSVLDLNAIDYMDIKIENSYISLEEAIQVYATELESSLLKTSKGKCGLLLSGGSDSAVIAAVLSKLGKLDLAIYFNYPNYANHEVNWVKELQKKYKFDLQIINYDYSSQDSWDELQKAAIISPTGFVPTILGFSKAAKEFVRILGNGSTIYDGELNILDLSYTEISDPTHNLRRFSYGGSFFPIVKKFPKSISSIFQSLNYLLPFSYSKLYHKYIDNLLTLIGSLGKPEDFYLGLKLGNRGLPGISRKILDTDFNFCKPDKVKEYISYFRNEIVFKYLKDSTSKSIRADIIKMHLKYYGDATNTRYMSDIMSHYGMGASHPFSNLGQYSLIFSLPENYIKYKKLQRLVSDKIYSMPTKVAYASKNHGAVRIDHYEDFYKGYFAKVIRKELQEKKILDFIDNSFFNINKINKELDDYLINKSFNSNITLYVYLSWIVKHML